MMESFLIYPYNLIFLGVGIVLVIIAVVFITSSKRVSKKNNHNKGK